MGRLQPTQFQNISLTGPARNRVKRCIVFRSAGIGSVSMTNMYVPGWAPTDLERTQFRHVICSRMRIPLHSEISHSPHPLLTIAQRTSSPCHARL
ncbi:hypothetical protein P692DRAFT_20354496 [Suillus brevipes Sb2]|nr:hypothetical protein P692DRAFT_20354496 [Suillus brevipes Sb2]